MTTLITGGAGFIGSHLVERLLIDECDVDVRDDFSTSVWSGLDLESLLRPRGNSNWSEGPIQHMRFHGSPDAIYHLASPVGPAGILKYAGNIVDEIVAATYAVIRIALENNCRLVYVSTSEVYGGGVNGLCREDMDCIVPLYNPSARLEYAIGKMAGEIAVMNTPGLDAVIIRPFNVAGPRQKSDGGFVLPRFVQQALAFDALTIFGDGKQVRAFTHVKDIVDGLLLAMKHGKSKQVYNLGNAANKTTINDLASRVIKKIGGDLERVRYMDGREVYGPKYAEANDKYPDASRAINELGWNPTRSIEDTIIDVIKYEGELHDRLSSSR